MVDIDFLIRKTAETAPFPVSTVRLAQLVATSDYHLADVIDIIRYDEVLTLRLLHVANSAASALYNPVTTVSEAVFRMGAGQILALAVAAGVHPLFSHQTTDYRYGEGTLWRHSMAAAVAAETTHPFCAAALPQNVFTAALLHDIGKLAIGRFLTDPLIRSIYQARDDGGLSQLDAETQILGVHHGELGGRIARGWNLPEGIVKGIVHHHNPELGNEAFCDFVYFSNQIAKQIESGLDGGTFNFMDDDYQDLSFMPGVIKRLGIPAKRIDSLGQVVLAKFEQISKRYNAL